MPKKKRQVTKKIIPYGHQTITEDDFSAVAESLKSDFLTQGPGVEMFEKELAKRAGAKYAVAVSSGTSALHLAYLVANIQKGDEVITTPNTFVATTNMLLILGAKPVFCDIRPDTCNIDESKIESLINERTKAIVPVHFAGHPSAMDKILQIAKKYKLLVIEDACHALGALLGNSPIGSIGDMTVFSFHPVKSITTGEGGAVLTDREDFYKRLVLLRSHGVRKDENGKNVMTELGYNYRLTDMQASLGLSQLKKLRNFIRDRNRVAKVYLKQLEGEHNIVLPVVAPGVKSAWHLFVVRVKDSLKRDALASFLKENGIGVNFHYPAVYSHPYYLGIGFSGFSLPEEEKYQSSCLTLPCYPALKPSEIKFVCDKIKYFFSRI